MQHTLDKTVSVIVPVYNAEKWLDRCVASLAGQSYPHMQIILIDDGSTDDSAAICDRWAEHDARVCAVHQQNAGAAQARRNGLKYTKGGYIGFADSDDYTAPDMYKTLIQAMGDADIAECGWYTVRENGEGCIAHELAEICVHGMECLQYYAEQRQCRNYLCNKLYRADLFEGIETGTYRCGEDAAWNGQLFLRAKNVRTVAKPLYYYVQQPQSICHETVSRKQLDGLRAWEYIYYLWQENTSEEQHFADYAALVLCSNAALLYMRAEILPQSEKKVLQDAAYACFERYDGRNAHWNIASRNRRLMLRLFRLSPRLCGIVYRKLG